MKFSHVYLVDAISLATTLTPYGRVISVKEDGDGWWEVAECGDLIDEKMPSDIVVSGGIPEDGYEWQHDGHGNYMRPFHADELPAISEIGVDDLNAFCIAYAIRNGRDYAVRGDEYLWEDSNGLDYTFNEVEHILVENWSRLSAPVRHIMKAITDLTFDHLD